MERRVTHSLPAVQPGVRFDFGWFSQNVGKFLGTSAWKGIFGIYLWHIIWGLNLGLIYNPKPAVEQL